MQPTIEKLIAIVEQEKQNIEKGIIRPVVICAYCNSEYDDYEIKGKEDLLCPFCGE